MIKDVLNIDVPKGVKIAGIGDIHEHEYQFDALIDRLQPSEKLWIVSVGDIYDKGDGPAAAERITNKMRRYCEQGIGFVIRGNHELKNIKHAKRTKKLTEELAWLEKQPLAVSFVFSNKTRLTAVHGGVRPGQKWADLSSDIEVCYIRNLDDDGNMIKLEWTGSGSNMELKPSKAGGKPWHHSYNGRFGYIVSGHEPQKDGVPKFYNYSCNIDTSVYTTGILTSQVFSESGRDELISVKGY